jgi:hypothetical protein
MTTGQKSQITVPEKHAEFEENKIGVSNAKFSFCRDF